MTEFEDACIYVDNEFSLTTDYEAFEELKQRINSKFAENNPELTLNYILRCDNDANENIELSNLLKRYINKVGLDNAIEEVSELHNKYKMEDGVYMDKNDFDSIFVPEDDYQSTEDTNYTHVQISEFPEMAETREDLKLGFKKAVSRSMFGEWDDDKLVGVKETHPVWDYDLKQDILIEFLRDKVSEKDIRKVVFDRNTYLSMIMEEYNDEYNEMLTYFLLHRAILEKDDLDIGYEIGDSKEEKDELFCKYLTGDVSKDVRFKMTKAVRNCSDMEGAIDYYLAIREEEMVERYEKVDSFIDGTLG